MKEKRVNRMLIVLAAAVFLTGCGNQISQKSSIEESRQESISGTLSILSWYNQGQYQPILDAFQRQYPEIEIDFQYVSSENNRYSQRLNFLAKAGELPDIVCIQPPVTSLAEDGYLMALDDLKAVRDLPESYQDAYTYDEKVYAYCNSVWIGGVYYNKALFEKFGLQEPRTYHEFLEICQTFHEAGIPPISMHQRELYDLVLWLHNTEVLSGNPQIEGGLNTGEATFRELYLDNLNTWKKDFIDSGYISKKYIDYSDDQRMDEFASEKAAMIISGQWTIGALRGKNPDLQIGTFPFVGTQGQQYTIGAINIGVGISTHAKNIEAAQAFINFLGTEEAMKLYREQTGNTTYSIPLGELDSALEPLAILRENTEYAYPPALWKYTAVFDEMMQKGMQEIMLGSKTPEALVEEMDNRLEELSK